jgi:hypothetical protein
VTHAAPALEAVHQKVDGFFARVATRYPHDLACASGCADCCAPDLTLTPLEAEAVEAYLASLDAETRARIARRAASSDGSACAGLDAERRCAIYPVRPIVCRSHGVVVRIEDDPGRRGLPVLDSCRKNFSGRDLTSVDGDCVLDQRTLSTVLAALHRASGRDVTGRRPLRALLEGSSSEEGVAR